MVLFCVPLFENCYELAAVVRVVFRLR